MLIPPNQEAGLENTCRTRTSTQIVHSIKTWKLAFPRKPFWSRLEVFVTKLDGLHDPRWPLQVTARPLVRVPSLLCNFYLQMSR